MLLELEGVAGEGDVVIGGEQGNQAEGDAAEHLEHTQAIKAQPAAGRWCGFWRIRRLRSAVGRLVPGVNYVGGRST